MYSEIKYLACGESAICIEFGDEICPEINAKIRRMVIEIEKQGWEGIVEMVPSYRSLLLNYDPFLWTYEEMVGKLKGIQLEEAGEESDSLRLIEIPTLYAGDCGPDLGFVAAHTKLSEEEVVKRHTSRDYLVYMLGFIPGFCYLGGMDPSIACPRLESPRLEILPGSVGIAGSQTGIYPSLSPGGWQIIGRTPLKMYDESKNPPVFVEAGDYIRYIPISEEEFQRIEKEVEAGSYEVNIRTIKRGELHV